MSAKTINDGGSVDGGNDANERILADEVSLHAVKCVYHYIPVFYFRLMVCRITTKASLMRATVITIAAIAAAGWDTDHRPVSAIASCSCPCTMEWSPALEATR